MKWDLWAAPTQMERDKMLPDSLSILLLQEISFENVPKLQLVQRMDRLLSNTNFIDHRTSVLHYLGSSYFVSS